MKENCIYVISWESFLSAKERKKERKKEKESKHLCERKSISLVEGGLNDI